MKGVLFCAGLLAVFGCGCLTPDRAEKDTDKTAEELTIAAWEKAVRPTNMAVRRVRTRTLPYSEM